MLAIMHQGFGVLFMFLMNCICIFGFSPLFTLAGILSFLAVLKYFFSLSGCQNTGLARPNKDIYPMLLHGV